MNLSNCRSVLSVNRFVQTRNLFLSSSLNGRMAAAFRRMLPLLDTSRVIEKEEKKENDKVVMSRNGQIVVCWHPEAPFPYEMTKPIPAEVIPTDSRLKVQALQPVREIFRKKNEKLVVTELMQLTNTDKRVWYCKAKPNRALRYRALNPKNEARHREYL